MTSLGVPHVGSAAERPLLSVAGLSIRFGGLLALDDVSFAVAPRQICGLIGPNGAGKTTVFNCLSGIYRPSAGEIRFKDRATLRVPSHRVAALGIGRTFQNLALFPEMSVIDNVMVGGYCRTKTGFLGGMLGTEAGRREEKALAGRVNGILDFFDLTSDASRQVGDLPFGIQKRVEFARALAGEPELLLLDEPAAGLNHHEVEALKAMILSVRERYRLAVLLVEHHMNLVMSVSDNVVALNFGRKIVDAPPAVAQEDRQLIAAYLGGGNE
ncbi:ABC transporter ATP-binding protein [Variovorax sp. YR752]|uniref:ABC transporter ATP-binding protein n=1 Tax=Variovorax sp. YR752 TaxID=1884383 RepID=UPI003137B6B5